MSETLNEKIEEAKAKLGKLHAEFRRSLRGIDGLLKSAVAQDPANLDAAQAVREAYGAHGFEPPPLAPLEQPEGPVDEPVVPVEEPVDDEGKSGESRYVGDARQVGEGESI